MAQLRAQERDGLSLWQAMEKAQLTPCLNLSSFGNDEPPAAAGSDLLAELQLRQPEDSGFVLERDQERLWWLDQFDNGNPALTINLGFEVSGAIDEERLGRSVWRSVLEQPLLRLTFPALDGVPFAQWLESYPRSIVTCRDLPPGENGDDAIMASAREAARQPLDLARGPLLGITVVRAPPERAVVFFALHHMIADLRSIALFARGVFEHYAALSTPGLERKPSMPAIGWGAPRSEQTTRHLRARAYWQDQLSSLDLRRLFRSETHLGKSRSHHRARTIRRVLPKELYAKIRHLSDAVSLSEPTLFLTAFRCFASLIVKRESFPIAVPLDRSSRGHEQEIGFAATPFPFEGAVDSRRSFLELAKETRRHTHAALKHRHFSFSELATLGAKKGDGSDAFFPEIMFSYSAVSDLARSFGDIAVTHMYPMSRASSDLEMAFWVVALEGDTCGIGFEFNCERITIDDAGQLIDGYLEVMDRCFAAPDGAVGPLLEQQRASKDISLWNGLHLRLLSTFADDPLRTSVEGWVDWLGIAATVSAAGYRQILQELMDPASPARRLSDAVLLLSIRVEDLLPDDGEAAAVLSDTRAFRRNLSTALDEYAEAIAAAAEATSSLVVVSFCPTGDLDSALKTIARELLETTAASLDHLANVVVVRPSFPDDATWSDAQAQRLANLPFTDEGFDFLAKASLRAVHERLRRPIKMVAVDCDNTLWKGVVGEQGPHGLELTPGHLALQQALVRAHETGFLICLCSKNSEEDVLAVLDQRDDMLLKRDMLAALKVDWNAKSGNIARLAEAFNIGLDSVLFLDDNEAEIAEVRANLPQVTAVTVPTDGEALEDFVADLWLLDRHKATEEDRARTGLYRKEAERTRHQEKAKSYEEFLESLAIELVARSPEAKDLPRLAQLTARTNQFNAAPEPWSEGKATKECARPDRLVRLIDVTDRFGSYGTVGLVAAVATDSALHVDQFLMSCRVLGRGIEHRMMNLLGTLAADSGAGEIVFDLVQTSRNLPVQSFLEQVPGARVADSGRGRLIVSRDTAHGLAFRPEAASRAALPAGRPKSDAAMLPSPGRPLARLTGAQWEEIRLVSRPGLTQMPPVAASTIASVPGEDMAKLEGQEALRQELQRLLGDRRLDWESPIYESGLSSLDMVRVLARINDVLALRLSFADIDPALSMDGLVALAIARRQAAQGPVLAHVAPKSAVLQDLELSRERVPLMEARAAKDEPRRTFLTGATGSLGPYLLSELLAASEEEVLCLVRAGDDDEAEQRLRTALRASGRPESAKAVGSRVHVLAGHLDRPRLGLSERRFSEVARSLSHILHNAAQVSFVAPYPHLRKVNVEGTKSILHLAALGGGTPLDFVSSLAVFDHGSCLDVPLIGEDELPDSEAGFLHDYALSKWVAERNLRTARGRGLPVTVYRPGNISGDSQSGHWTPGDTLTRILRFASITGTLPSADIALDLTPVDFVARAILSLRGAKGAEQAAYHLASPRRFTLVEIADWLEQAGLPVELVPLDAWCGSLAGFADRHPKDPAAALAAIFAPNGPRDETGPSFFEVAARRARFSTAHAQEDLGTLGISCPVVEKSTFARYVGFLRQSGYLSTRHGGMEAA